MVAEPSDAALAAARRDLLRELTVAVERPTRIFVHRYLLTLSPLAAAAAALWLWPGVAAAVAFALVAGLTQNALGVLMHEGSHRFFHPDRRTNDLLADVFVCLPIFNTIHAYREEHFRHHRRSGEDDDPYHDLYGGYRRPHDMIKGLLQDLCGISAVRLFVRRYMTADPGRASNRRARALALVTAQSIIAVGLWQLTGSAYAWIVLWVLPLMTIPVAINRIRTFVEHYPGFEALPANRTTLTGVLEYLCVAPYGYSHHFEHHFAPTVPYYRLAWAHEFLKGRGVALRSHQYTSAGYVRTFRRMMRELAAEKVRVA